MQLNEPTKRESYVHQAGLLMAAGADPGAPGAAITVELCGSWEHPPPCPLAPHHTSQQRDGESLKLRIVFVAEAEEEDEVRRRIDKALGTGELTGPGGVITRWTLLHSEAADLSDAERAHAQRIAQSQ